MLKVVGTQFKLNEAILNIYNIMKVQADFPGGDQFNIKRSQIYE